MTPAQLSDARHAYLSRLLPALATLRSRIAARTASGQDVPLSLALRERAMGAMVGRMTNG